MSKDREHPIVWNDEPMSVWLVVYRGGPGRRLSSADGPQGRIWVHPDGRVLKQQVRFFNSRLTFIRLPEHESAALAAKLRDKPRRLPAEYTTGSTPDSGP